MSDVVAAIAPEVFEDDPRKLRATSMSIFGMLNWFYMWNSPADQKARDEYAKLVTRLTLTGVGGGGACAASEGRATISACSGQRCGPLQPQFS